MSGLPLFNIPESPAKQVTETSREVYQSIVLPNLNARQTMVLKALNYYIRTQDEQPTAYELLEFMRKWKPELDVNNVRPRLTDMQKPDLRFVEMGEKRRCQIKHTPAHVWILTPRGEAYLRDKK